MNQYTTTPFDSREYDANGNTVYIDDGVEQLTLTYDYRNQLVEASEAISSRVSNYSYDPLGRRISRTVSAPTPTEWRYAYDGMHILEEQDGVGGALATYAYGWRIDKRLGMDEATDLNGNFVLDSYTYHGDDLGSVMAVTDGAGAKVEGYAYDDYGSPEFFDGVGTPLSSSAIFNPYLFTARRYDEETGWYEYRTRYLDPRAGRFLTRDTIGIWGDQLNLGNAYSYIGNNPASLTDPLGLGDFVVGSKVKSVVKGSKMNAAGALIDAVDKQVQEQVNKAVEKAKAAGKKAVEEADIRDLIKDIDESTPRLPESFDEKKRVVVKFVYGGITFKSVYNAEKIPLFTEPGIPVRATVTISLKESIPEEPMKRQKRH